jgi:CTP-dependent riboflavin kinase
MAHFGPIDFIISNNDWVKEQFQPYPQIRFIATELFQRDLYRGGVIRALIQQADSTWKDLLPSGVTEYLEEINAEQILPQVCYLDSHPEETQGENKINSLDLVGTVVSGTQIASQFVQVPHFYEAMTRMLGAPPYLGTLNLQLNIPPGDFQELLASYDPLRINPQDVNLYEYWGVDCFPAIIQASPEGGQKAFVVLLDFGAQKEWTGVVELVAHPHLRTFLSVEDGTRVSLKLLD